MKFLVLLASMPLESDQILSRLKYLRSVRIAGKTVYKGKLSGIDIILLNSGIGKVNAAHSATCIVEHFPVKSVINIGVGGAYPNSGLNIGDIAIASKEIYGDDGVITSKGFESLKKIGIPLVRIRSRKYFNEFPLNGKTPSSRTRTGMGDFKIRSGNFITVSATTGTHKRAVELEKRFNALCENMEGAAIAHVCAIYKIPMLEIRGISNIVGVRDKRKWNLKLASENCQKFTLEITTQGRNAEFAKLFQKNAEINS